MSYDQSKPPPYAAYPNPPNVACPNPPNVVYGNPPNLVYATPANVVYTNPPYAIQMGPNAAFVKDYLAWSITNLICGWGAGFIPLIFSILCRNSKNANDYSGAQTMSTLAFVFNIIITIGGVIGWIIFIIIMAIYIAAINSHPFG